MLKIFTKILKNMLEKNLTFQFEIDRPLPIGKNKKVIRQMKDEIGGQIMKKIIGLRVKTYIYLKDNNDKDKKSETDKKQSVIKRNLKFRDYEKCLKASQIEN